MLVYYILLMMTFFVLFFSRKIDNSRNGRKAKMILIFYAIFLLSFFSGIRWNVGTDFMMYNSFFHNFKENFVLSLSLEPLFIAFCYIPGLIFNTSTMTFLLIALYTYSLVFFVCKKNCKYYDIAFFLFISMGFYFSSLNIVRQWMAIPIILIIYSLIAEKKYMKAVICFFLSVISHYTSIVVLPFLFTIKVIHKESTRIIMIVVAVLLRIFSDHIIRILQNILIKIAFLSKYAYYFNKTSTMNASLILPIICILVYIYYLLFLAPKKSELTDNEMNKINVFINVLILAFTFTLVGAKVDIFERMSHYFFPIVILIIPKVLEYIKGIFDKRVIICLIIISGVAFYTNSMRNNGGEILPYNTIYKEIIK